MDETWLPEGVMDWPMVAWRSPGTYLRQRGTLAYEMRTAGDGRVVDITEWLEGFPIRRWRREPITGTGPGTYGWREVDPRACEED